MAKAKKHYLEKKIDGINKNYAKIPDQYSELKNIYRGRDKDGKRNKKLHKLKDRYDAAEAYLQTLDKQTLTPEQRKYVAELARTFLEYDLILDKKRKEPEYKESLRKKRIEHLGKTLEAMAEDETPILCDGGLSNKVYKTLDNYVQTPKPVTQTQPKKTQPNIIVPPASLPSQASIKGPGLVARVHNATARGYNATSNAIKKYWKYGVTFVAGAALGSLLTYYCMTKPVIKPTVKEPPKQEYVTPKQETPPIIKHHEPKKPIIKEQEPKKPIIEKQDPPVIKEQEPKKETPIIKEEPKQVIEEQKPVIEEQKPVAPKVEQIILTEKDWTKKFKKGEIDLNKYDLFVSGMWDDPGAIVAYEKGSDKITFDTAFSGDLMWDKVETKKELDDLIWMMYKNNAFDSGRVAPHAEHVKNKKGEVLGVIFTDALGRSQVNQKDGKVMVYSIERRMPNGSGDDSGSNGSSGGGSGGGGSM